MNGLKENFEINSITIVDGENERDLFRNSDSELRDQKHLEMAYEWLYRRTFRCIKTQKEE